MKTNEEVKGNSFHKSILKNILILQEVLDFNSLRCLSARGLALAKEEEPLLSFP